MKKIYLKLFTLSIVFVACKKEEETKGCTDPSATNYNSSATLDDGSCTYAATNNPINNINIHFMIFWYCHNFINGIQI